MQREAIWLSFQWIWEEQLGEGGWRSEFTDLSVLTDSSPGVRLFRHKPRDGLEVSAQLIPPGQRALPLGLAERGMEEQQAERQVEGGQDQHSPQVGLDRGRAQARALQQRQAAGVERCGLRQPLAEAPDP